MKDGELVQDGLQGLSVQDEDRSEDQVAVVLKKEEQGNDAALGADHSNRPRSLSRSKSPKEHNGHSDGTSLTDKGRPRVSRKSSQKMAPRAVTLVDGLPDVTEESYEHFQVIPECLYGSKSLGSTEHGALDCDCSEEWRRFPCCHILVGRRDQDVLTWSPSR
jgi:[histone H3]-lysine36 N-trimethyltransferase